MQDDIVDQASSRRLPLRAQAMLVGCLAAAAAVAATFFLLRPGKGAEPQAETRPPRLMTDGRQGGAQQYEIVRLQNFQTETLTDGYVAPNGGWSSAGRTVLRGPGIPVLQGQTADLIQAEADLATARAQLVAASANERRQHALYQADGASLKDWQQAQVDAATAASTMAAAQNKLRALGKDEASIQALERNSDGAAPRVFRIGSPALVWLVANIREGDAGHVHIGDRAEVTIPGLQGRILEARIGYIGSAIDPVTHRLPVAALYRNADGLLRPNMLASFDILDRDESLAPAVPQNAIIYEGEQARVWVLQPTGRLVLRDVTVGRLHKASAEILSGLRAGERVVTGGALFIDQAPAGG